MDARTPLGDRARQGTTTSAAGSAPTSARATAVVSDRAERMDAWVTTDASLKDALATMLQWDAGWVAVLDGDQFLGVLTRTPCTRRSAARSAPRRGRPTDEVSVSTTGPLH